MKNITTKTKSLKSGKLEVNILKSAAYTAICAAVISIALILKITLWDNSDFVRPAFAFLMIVISVFMLMSAFMTYMLISRRRRIIKTNALYAAVTALTISYLICLAFSFINVLIVPFATAAFLLAPLLSRRDALTANFFNCFLMFFTQLLQFHFAGNLDFGSVMTAFICSSAFGSIAAYTISATAGRYKYLLRGFMLSFIAYGFVVFSLYAFLDDLAFFKSEILYAIGGIFAPVVISLILQPFFERIFNLVTNTRLVELTDHNSPLIKRLRTETPGTFNHCLTVANLAEMCASAIGENPYLARACAYYHDVGKLANPQYFTENQQDENPHDELLPEISADIIRGHTTIGHNLCQEYKIPQEIAHVTVQHHGTMLIPSFYNKAQGLTDSAVDPDTYRYFGVKPKTKIAAIIMICDCGEAAIRSMDLTTRESINKLLADMISMRIGDGQFDNCAITMGDLHTLRETIVGAYGGLFHKRIKYPGKQNTDAKTNDKASA